MGTLLDDLTLWAKRSNIGSEKQQLDIVDFLVGLFSLKDDGRAQSSLGQLTWPEECIAAKAAAEKVAVESTSKPIPVSPQVKLFRKEALKTPDDVSAILNGLITAGHTQDVVRAFVQANRSMRDRMKSIINREQKGFLEQEKKMREFIRSRMIGNDEACKAVLDAWRRTKMASLYPKETKASQPLGIFTLLGAPGAGKTMLAKLFAEALSIFEADPFEFVEVDCTMLSNPQSSGYLVGDEGKWKNAKEGFLTGRIKKHPRTVILFDEMEKMADTAINTLLRLLNEGKLHDMMLGEDIDFTQTYIFFTTNLGREIFSKKADGGALSGAINSAEAFQILRDARSRTAQFLDRDMPSLPEEFVSRLEKGAAIWFPGLRPAELMDLMHHTLRKVFQGAFASFAIDDELVLLMLLSLLPGISARKVANGTVQSLMTELRDECAYRIGQMDLSLEASENARFQIKAGGNLKPFLEELFARTHMDVVLIDLDVTDDHSATVAESVQRFKASHDGSRTTFTQMALDANTTDPMDIVDKLRRLKAPVVLLDLSPAGYFGHKQSMALLGLIRKNMPNTPVLCFGRRSADAGEEFVKELKSRIQSAGGVRDLILFDEAQGKVDNEVLQKGIHTLLESLRLETIFRLRERMGMSLEFLPPAIAITPAAAEVQVEACFERVISRPVNGAREVEAGVVAAGIPSERFDNVAGLWRAKKRFNQVLNLLKEPARLNRFGIQPPRGFLLAGPPGTGKTLLARALAGEAELPFFAISMGDLAKASDPVEKLQKYFESARSMAPSLMFFDEIDAIAMSRDHVGPSILFNELLAQMDGFKTSELPIFFLAATNKPDMLDSAIRRPGRFDEIIPIDLPEASARRDFFLRALKNRMTAENLKNEQALDMLVSGTAGNSPAELDRIIREAAYIIAASSEPDRDITWAELEKARSLVRFGAVVEPESQEENQERRRLTAIHEAGHAVAVIATFGADCVDYVTIVPHENGAAGFMAWDMQALQKSPIYGTEKFFRWRLVVSLAGRAAEYIAAGKQKSSFTAGASSDLEAATSTAYEALARYGMDSNFGMAAIHVLPQTIQMSLGGDIKDRINEWIKNAFDEAVTLLMENKGLHDSLVTELLGVESLYQDKIMIMVNSGD